ncbi:ABC-type nitrate/sulfonate/bicarbonate transport system, permease component [Amphibacillus marinus]|uniref:ABC-type nitrate/sulfonate/bicarbonate transport system, permease component n=1 Tax=Amphibacillus marinus TaxID=872970 RepID=A0A1H8IN60_9BACI|nr:ABC transporter permease [Amphibacillus marinus]SEN70014.1 ABC-type nitrate/sulfonate/bicarbonate transport system, permease component [Amphibacillus marinus]
MWLWKKSWLAPTLVIIGMLIVWESATMILAMPTWLLPAPTIIAREIITSWSAFQQHFWATTSLAVIGFIVGVSIGLLLALVLHLCPRIRQSIYPILIMSQNIPIIVLAPLLVIWFGFGLFPKIIVITLVCFFPIVIATLAGLGQTNDDLLHYLRMSGASKKQIFLKLELPHSVPSILSGLKISATYSVMGAVISEWLGANRGIGLYMTLAQSSFRTDRVFVAIFFIMLVCMCFFGTILFLEHRVLKGFQKRGRS